MLSAVDGFEPDIAKFSRGMLLMRQYLPPLLREISPDRRGVTALEYGLLAAIVAASLIGVLPTFGSDVRDLFNNVSIRINAVGGSTSSPPGD